MCERERERVWVHAQSSLILCGQMACSSAGSSVHGIFQARILEWLPFPTPGDLLDPGIKPASLASPALVGRFFTTVPPGNILKWSQSLLSILLWHFSPGYPIQVKPPGWPCIPPYLIPCSVFLVQDFGFIHCGFHCLGLSFDSSAQDSSSGCLDTSPIVILSLHAPWFWRPLLLWWEIVL